jgi:hypothetical protein
MKTLLILSFLAFFHFSEAQEVAAKATFGRYSADCIGRGLCSFEVANDRSAASKSAQKISANTFVLKINRTSVSDADQINIAGKRFKDFAPGEQMFFQQPDNLKLDSEVLYTFRIDQVYNIIAPGSYPIVLTTDTVEVTFKLTASKK